jgi:hypothetical protein
MKLTIIHPRSNREYQVIHSRWRTVIPFERIDFNTIEVPDEFDDVATIIWTEMPRSMRG